MTTPAYNGGGHSAHGTRHGAPPSPGANAMTPSVWVALVLALFSVAGQSGPAAQTRKAPPAAKPFHTTVAAADMANKQAVVETSAGTFVIALLPQSAPNHVGYFLRLVKDGAYAGTTFHRVVKDGIAQGGDPLSNDPSKKALYG